MTKPKPPCAACDAPSKRRIHPALGDTNPEFADVAGLYMCAECDARPLYLLVFATAVRYRRAQQEAVKLDPYAEHRRKIGDHL